MERSIALIGFMAAGKTRAGRAIGAALSRPAVDVDEELERNFGEPAGSLFSRLGEAEFRRREEAVTLRLLAAGGIVSLGGGAVENPVLRKALADHVAVWCRISEQGAWDRAQRKPEKRPLVKDRAEFSARYAIRLPLYEQCASVILPRGGDETPRLAAPWLAALQEMSAARMVWAETASAAYPALIGAGAISKIGCVDPAAACDARRFHLLADPNALAHHENLLGPVASRIVLGGSEQDKTLGEAGRVLGLLAAAGARRDEIAIAFGGGVVGDIAGFCAAVYQRGIGVVQVPTTLVAQVDSAYGGKTGVDLPTGKNYVGAFHQPLAVLADPSTLSTLPAAELSAGFAEVVKTALLAGGPLWERVRAIEKLGADRLDEIIFACARTKLDIVAEDERDDGVRANLNLGHTVGHAIETVGKYRRYRHGEAISLGLLAALRLSGADDLRDEVAALLARAGLPTELDPALDIEQILTAIARDKKAGPAGVGFVLLERPGECRRGQLIEAATLRSAVAELVGK